MPIRLNSFPTLGALCLGGLAGLLLSSVLLLGAANIFARQLQENYGRALSSMAARQAVDAAFNHDLVRLQVILQDTVENPGVSLATIHDVENTLLVQAGDARFGLAPGEVFTYPIVLQDSIAGYVAVTIDDSTLLLDRARWLLLLATSALLAVAAWSLYRARSVEWVAGREPETANPAEADAAGCAEGDNAHLIEDENFAKVSAVIHIKNLNVLKQQLNGQTLRATLARLEKIIADVLALYGGRQFQLVGNYYVLTFHASDSLGEALFRATCGAHLVLELAGIINNIPLDLAALISANDEDIIPERLPFAGLMVEASAGEDELINRRVKFMNIGTSDGRKVLAGFTQPFQSLLDKQQKQLAQIL